MSTGGGIYACPDSYPTIVNSIVACNAADGGVGGGIALDDGGLVADCDVLFNHAGLSGGGLRLGNSNATVVNCIVWGNNSPANAQIDVVAGSPLVAYCCVENGWLGPGNISDDPSFVDPLGPDDVPCTRDEDYRLSSGSPCIDAACNCGVPPDMADLDDDGDTDEPTPLDLDGEGRFFDDPNTPDTGSGLPPIVDMGPYEFGGTGPQPCFGDLDGDDDIDLGDLATLLANYGTTSGATYTDGDLDCDGDVGLDDLAALLSVYGTVCP